MSYRVVVTDTALEAIRGQARFIAIDQQLPVTAARWLRRVLDAADTLADMPRRCSLAPEDAYRSYEIRWLDIDDFMLLFTVVEETGTVLVIGARHSRRLPRATDLPSG